MLSEMCSAKDRLVKVKKASLSCACSLYPAISMYIYVYTNEYIDNTRVTTDK